MGDAFEDLERAERARGFLMGHKVGDKSRCAPILCDELDQTTFVTHTRAFTWHRWVPGRTGQGISQETCLALYVQGKSYIAFGNYSTHSALPPLREARSLRET